MTNNTFKIIGKLGIGKASDRFNPFTSNTSERGWVSKRLSFYIKNDINFCNLEISGGYSSVNPVVYSFTKGSEKEKGKSIQIAWNDRFDKNVIDKVAEFKKNVIVFNNEKRTELISGYDFAQEVYNIINSDEYKDSLWKVEGNVVTSEWQGKFYTKYVPTRMYLVDDDSEHISEGTLEFHFGQNCIDDQYSTIGKIFLSGYTREYDGNRKREIGIPLQNIEISFANVNSALKDKIYKKWVNIFTCEDDEFKKIGLKVNYLSGSQDIEFNEDMLDDEQKEMIELGFMTLDDIKKEMGVGKTSYENVTRVAGLAKGYSKGSIDTGLTLKDYILDSNEDSTDIDDLFNL